MTVSCWKRAWKALAAALRGFLWPCFVPLPPDLFRVPEPLPGDKGGEGATVVPTPSPGSSDDRGKP